MVLHGRQGGRQIQRFSTQRVVRVTPCATDAHVAFEARQSIDNMVHRALDCLDRILGAAFAVFEIREWGIACTRGDDFRRRRVGAGTAAAQLFDINQKVGQSAFHALEHAQPRVGRVEPLHQHGDAIFKMCQCGLVGLRELGQFKLVDERGEELLEFARHGVAVFRRSVDRGRQRIDATLDCQKRVVAGGGLGEIVHLRRKQAHLFAKPAHGIVGSNPRNGMAEVADGDVQLLHRARIALGDITKAIDLCRQQAHFVSDRAQRVARGNAGNGVAQIADGVVKLLQRR